MIEELFTFIVQNRGKLLGVLGGLILGWVLITRGLVAAFLLCLCVGFGWYIGKRLDEGEELGGFLERFLPPHQR